MDPAHKKTLKAIVLELRHLLEGWYDGGGSWHPGDLEQRLAAIGVRRDREPMPVDELPHLLDDDKHAREVVDAYLALRREAGIKLRTAVGEFVRETAYTWANRLLALRCMEARELIDEVILQKEVYGGRSLEHHRLAQRQPELCAGEDDGLFAILDKIFAQRANILPLLFDPKAAGVALKPTAAALKRCVALLSGIEAVNGQTATHDMFKAADAFGWAYQYWNAEEKDRVFEKVRTQKGAKIEGADIIPATQLYTEPYMVKFLVQNSLGAMWVGMRSDTKLVNDWEYFVRDADRASVEKKPVREITFLDPACGSGHFLIEAFDLFYTMYEEEGKLAEPEEICRSILGNNLYGIDIDERAVQIAEAVLWMKAAEKAFNFTGAPMNLIATNICLPKGKDHIKAFLKQHPDDEPLRPALEVIFEGLEHADELGSLLQIEEPVEKELKHLKENYEAVKTRGGVQARLFEPTIIQGKLPLDIENYDDWRQKIVTALKDHFTAEAESAELKQAFFSQSAGKGLALFDLLTRRYDVVAANPPYMGSKNMGPVIKKYVEHNYKPGKRDLYASFILRCRQVADKASRIAMITMNKWLFQTLYSDFRVEQIIDKVAIEVIADLGSRAFDPENKFHDGVQVALFIFRAGEPKVHQQLIGINATDGNNPSEKDGILRSELKTPDLRTNFHEQAVFTSLPNSPILFALTPRALEVFRSPGRLVQIAKARQGLASSNNARYLRFFWEVINRYEWVRYYKGGGYGKWFGLNQLTINWRANGLAVKEYARELYGSETRTIKNQEFYFRPCVTYTQTGAGCMGARLVDPAIFDVKGICVFSVRPEIPLSFIAALLSTHSASLLLRVLTQSLEFHSGYVDQLPIGNAVARSELLSEIGMCCIALKRCVVDSDPVEPSFVVTNAIKGQYEIVALLHLLEGVLEEQVSEPLGLTGDLLQWLTRETGTPAGWFPLINGFDSLPTVPTEISELPQEIFKFLERHERRLFAPHELSVLSSKLRTLYEAGPGAKIEEKSIGLTIDDESEEKGVVGARIPIPPETFLEELSQKLGIHPISTYWIMKKGIEKEGWRCLPEERRIATDRFTVIVLRLLGHRWPKQIEANEPIPDWADEDGIIPLTDGTSEETLVVRVRKRIAVEFKGGDVASIEREFPEIMGKPIDQWLETEFFKQHVKQFKRRPIVWQIQSGKYTPRTKPALACLVYYHKLDGDTLPKIRTQYVGPLRQRYETELRGIEAVPVDARSARQDKRRVELERVIEELKEFDTALQKTATEAFSSKKLETIIAKEKPDKWCSIDGTKESPNDGEAFLRQERLYIPDINDGVRVNIAPLQKAGLIATPILAKKDLDKAIADRAEWRVDERRWCREGKLPQPGWWVTKKAPPFQLPIEARTPFPTSEEYVIMVLLALLDEGNGSVDVYRLAGAYSLLVLPDLLLKYAPSELKQQARQWEKTYCEEVQADLLRPTIRELAEKGVIGLTTKKDGVVAVLYDSSIASRVEPWVRADAFIALRVVQAMGQRTLNTVLQSFPEEELEALVQSAA